MDDLYFDEVTPVSDYQNPFYVTIANPSNYYYQLQMRLEEAEESERSGAVLGSSLAATVSLVSLLLFSSLS